MKGIQTLYMHIAYMLAINHNLMVLMAEHGSQKKKRIEIFALNTRHLQNRAQCAYRS